MILAFGPRTRALLIVAVLALAAAGAGLIVLGRSQSSTEAAPKPTAPAKPALPSAPALRSPGATTARPVGAKLPAAVEQALSANRVAVVELYDPAAKVDGTALHEASAGAQLAGAAFVAVDVTTSAIDSLNRRFGVLHDPAVLVLRPPGDLIVRIDGFADRDTVAQAATNAAS